MKRTKKKILFIVQLPPPIHGAAVMNKLIVESELVNENYNYSLVSLDFVKEIHEIGVFNLNKILQMIKVFFQILYKLLFFRPNLVFFNLSFKGGAFYRDVVYISLVKLFNAPIIYYIQGKGINESSKKSTFNKRLFLYIFKNENVVCLSELLKHDIEDVFFGKPFIVNNAIKTQNLEKVDFKKDIDIINIIYLSALDKDKGLFVLLDSIKILVLNGYNFNVKIIGSPLNISFFDLNEHIAANNLNGYITVLGPKYDNEKFKELLESDIFVFPTLNEAFGLVNLEAMQCGLPIISTYEGAIPEIVDDGVTGFLVEKNNSIELAKKIEILLVDPILRNKMGEAGRKKFFEKYTIERFEQNMKIVFDDILNNMQ